MNLTLAEVVYLEGHDVHCPTHAKTVIQQALEFKRRKQPLDPKFSALAGLCQKVLVQKQIFKKLYKSAYCQGMFNRDCALSTRHSLT